MKKLIFITNFKLKLFVALLLFVTVFAGCQKSNSSGENSSSSQVPNVDEANVYNSPVIYIKNGNDKLLIAEKDGIQTTYGFDGKEEKSSSFKPISLDQIQKSSKSDTLNVALYSIEQPEFCKKLKLEINKNSLVLSIEKEHVKLTTLTTCSFKLTSLGKKELKINKLNFHFSYTNNDWRANTQAKEVNHTIDVLIKYHINENAMKLDIRKREIKDITPILGLVNLQTVNLSENQLVEVSGLSQLIKLKKLDLSKNQIKNFQSLYILTQLKELYLNNNQIEVSPDVSKLTELTTLFLSNNQLKVSPDLSKLTNLEILYLNNNQLKVSPDLSKLTKLGVLFLDENQLTVSPDLSKLTELATLSLSRNQLTVSPDLSKLTELTTLSLSHNQLTVSPDMSKLTKLNALLLEHNQLTKFPDISKLKNLNSVFLNNNKITEIPDFSNLANLNAFYLNNNQIHVISQAVFFRIKMIANHSLENNPGSPNFGNPI